MMGKWKPHNSWTKSEGRNCPEAPWTPQRTVIKTWKKQRLSGNGSSTPGPVLWGGGRSKWGHCWHPRAGTAGRCGCGEGSAHPHGWTTFPAWTPLSLRNCLSSEIAIHINAGQKYSIGMWGDSSVPAVTRTTLNACRWWALDRQTDALTCRGATVGVLGSGQSDTVHPTSQSVVSLLNFLPKPKYTSYQHFW